MVKIDDFSMGNYFRQKIMMFQNLAKIWPKLMVFSKLPICLIFTCIIFDVVSQKCHDTTRPRPVSSTTKVLRDFLWHWKVYMQPPKHTLGCSSKTKINVFWNFFFTPGSLCRPSTQKKFKNLPLILIFEANSALSSQNGLFSAS